MRYDVAVIGSGISGMSAAAALAGEGLSVIVLEKHDSPGGLMRTYRRAGLVVPTGIHLVGSLGEGEILWRYFKYLGIIDKVKFDPMTDDEAFEIRFPGLVFPFRGGREEFLEDLTRTFGARRAVAERFISDMKETVSGFPLYTLNRRKKESLPAMGRKSLLEYFNEINASSRERALLSGLNPFYGVEPSQCPVATNFIALDSFVNSRWRADERKKTLVQAFLDALSQRGAEVSCGAAVTAIEVRGRKLQGVRLETGDVIECSRAVYTGHPKRLPDLLPADALRAAFKERLSGLDETIGAFGVLAVCDDPKAMPHGGCVIMYADFDTERPYRQRLVSSGEEPAALFLSFEKGDAGKWGLQIIAFSDPLEWERWRRLPGGNRGQEYLSAKGELAGRVVETACSRMGIEIGALEVVDTFTPLTIKDYIHGYSSGVYGIKKSVSIGLAGAFSARTRVKGLYLAGQNIFLPGVVGTVISAINACGCILGYDRLMDSVERAIR